MTITDQVMFLSDCCILLPFALNLRRCLGGCALRLTSVVFARIARLFLLFEPQQQLGHVLRGLENRSGIIKNNQTKNSGSGMFVWLKQFLSLFQWVAIHALARMTKQVWKVIGAVELLSDGHKKAASVSKP